MDMEYAREIVRREAAGVPQPVSEAQLTPLRYGPVEQRLDLVANLLMYIRSAVQAGYTTGHKEPKVRPLPTPKTALEIARQEAEFSELRALSDWITGADMSMN